MNKFRIILSGNKCSNHFNQLFSDYFCQKDKKNILHTTIPRHKNRTTMKKLNLIIVLLLLVVLLFPSAIYAQNETQSEKQNEAQSKTGSVLSKNQVNEGDLFVADLSVKNDGVVKGDYYVLSRDFANNGNVVGDLLAAAQSMVIKGNIEQDVRIAGGDISLDALLGRNLNVLSQTVKIGKKSTVNGNLISVCARFSSEGSILGTTRIFSPEVILGGTYSGNVYVNCLDESGSVMAAGKTKITVLPDTVIKGKLVYVSDLEADIAPTAKTGGLIRRDTIAAGVSATARQTNLFTSIFGIFGILATTIAFFGISILLIRLFPQFFIVSRDLFTDKTPRMFLIGLISLLFTFVSVLIFVILFFFSLVTVNMKFLIAFSAFAGGGYILVSFLSLVPVGLWLGRIISAGRNNNISFHLLTGLLTIDAFNIILGLSGKILGITVLTAFIQFLTSVFILLTGSGAILASLYYRYKKLRILQV